MSASRTSRKFRSTHFTDEFVQSIDHMPYFQARHLNEPIYKVMIMELYEQGCLIAADCFTCLVVKEQKLRQKNVVRMLVREEPKLLETVFEHVKLAEKAAKLSYGGGMLACLKLLYQLLQVLEKYVDDFDWLLSDLYNLFVKIAERHEDPERKCNEIKAHLFCSYALYSAKNAKLNLSSEYFEKALELCRGERWFAGRYREWHGDKTLHDFVALNFARELISSAKDLMHIDPSRGIEHVHRALAAILEVNESHNQPFLCDIYITKIDLLIEQKKYIEALRNIELTEERANSTYDLDFYRITCELSLQEGICCKHLHEFSKALTLFKKSLSMSQEYGLQKITGLALMNIASLYTVYSTGGDQQTMYAYSQAKRIFDTLQDKQNKQRAVYSLARLMVKNMHTDFLKVVHDSDQYCDLLKLRKWKYMCQPSWQITETTPVDVKTLEIEEDDTGEWKEDDESELEVYDVLEKAEHEELEKKTGEKPAGEHKQQQQHEESKEKETLPEKPAEFIEQSVFVDTQNWISKELDNKIRKTKALECLFNAD